VSDWMSDEIIVHNIHLHYLRTGGGGPPLVLCHGITDNAACWRSVAQAFEKDYDVLMVDARGHGLSDAPETGYSPEDRAADLAAFVQALDLDKPSLLGHSMGADTIALAAATYPDHAGCVILEDPPWTTGVESEAGRAAMAAEWRAKMLQRKSLSLEEIIAAGHQQHPNWPEAELSDWAEAKHQVSLHVLQAMAGFGLHWRDTAAAIPCPVLLIRGDPELGGLVGPQVAEELATRHPRIQVAHLTGAGHSIHRERFELFVETVADFLSRTRG